MRQAAWREIPGFPNYMISSEGEIINVNRNRQLSLHFASGSWRVILHRNNVQYNRVVADLLGEIFLGYSSKHTVTYKDGNPHNLSLSNLVQSKKCRSISRRNSRPVHCVETGRRYDSIRQCAEDTGFNYKAIKYSIDTHESVTVKYGSKKGISLTFRDAV